MIDELVFMATGTDRKSGIKASVFKKFREDEITIQLSNLTGKTAVIDWTIINKLMVKVESMERKEEKKRDGTETFESARKKLSRNLQRKIDKQR